MRKSIFVFILLATLPTTAAQNDLRIIDVPANISGLPRIEGSVLDAVLGLAKTRVSASMVPVAYARNGRLAVMVLSNRAIIARNNASTLEQGGRYTPPDALKPDVVMVVCGSAERINEIFNCQKAAVTLSNGQALVPLTSSGETREFRNALGASWTARIVTALFRATDLANGFTVDFADDNGAEWTFKPSKEDIEGRLFLAIDSAGTVSPCAARAQC